jgi:hypothetical protein
MVEGQAKPGEVVRSCVMVSCTALQSFRFILQTPDATQKLLTKRCQDLLRIDVESGGLEGGPGHTGPVRVTEMDYGSEQGLCQWREREAKFQMNFTLSQEHFFF